MTRFKITPRTYNSEDAADSRMRRWNAYGPGRGKNELAVMVDTFKSLLPTEHAMAIEDPGYNLSWVK